jgi:hopanoid-associated phosphorylase
MPGWGMIAVVGMTREAQILERLGYAVVVGGGDVARVRQGLAAALAEHPEHPVISFGVCGGLAEEVRAGELIVASAVLHKGERWGCHDGWARRLLRANHHARIGTIAGSDTAIGDVAGKQALWATTGALAVDMESHVAARMAAEAERPFAVVRAVSDGAGHTLPPAALAGLRPDGTADIGAVLTALAARPAQLPALIRTAQGAAAAYRTLEAVRDRLIGP